MNEARHVRQIALSGVTSCENRGVEALVKSITGGLADLGDCHFTILTQTPDYDKTLIGDAAVTFVADPFVASRTWRHSRAPETPAAAAERAAALLSETDLLVTTGGDLHTGDYGVSNRYLVAPRAAAEAGVPVAMLAHSIGPFAEAAEAAAFAAVARRASVVTVREAPSLRYARYSLGLNANLTQTADPASTQRTSEILAAAGIAPGEPYVCLAPSQGIAGFRKLHHEQHRDSVLALTSALQERWALPIVLVPHVHDQRPGNDDRILTADIAGLSSADVRILQAGLTAGEYKGICAGAMLVVAERLHAAIAALSSAVPTAVIGYSPKFAGVLADAYGGEVAGAHVTADVRSFVDDPIVATSLIKSLDIERLKAILIRRSPEIRRRAALNMALAWAVMTGIGK
jgi:polysaccharide pyruvyl transferase WcaK-like protein